MEIKRQTYLFTGTVIARQPLAYSPPDSLGPDKKSLLPKMTVPHDSGPMDRVFVSGSSIRGKLRHACADAYLERKLEKKERVDYEHYLELKVGGVKGSSSEDRVSLQERSKFLSAEPFLDLFGAGSSKIGWIHSRLDVGAAIPTDQIEPITLKGVRRDAAMDPVLLEVLDKDEICKVLQGQEANRIRSQKASEVTALNRQIRTATKRGQDTAELEQRLTMAEEEFQKAKNKQKEILGSDVSLLLPLPGYEAIPSGTVLNHRMFLKNVVPFQLSLFMAGLERFAADPRLGAHRAQGCGRVCLEYQVKRIEGVSAQAVGAVMIDPDLWDEDESSLRLSGEPDEWLKAWHASPEAP